MYVFATRIISLKISCTGGRKHAIAILHLEYRPLECRGSFVRFSDYRNKQMRQSVVPRKLHTLRINQDHAKFLGSSCE